MTCEAWRHGEKMTTVPAKPTTMPASLAGVGRFSWRAAMATTTVHSGVVALRMPATAESTWRSP
jgi:hypothetical protein